ncbi:MAG: DUF2127 domain-containing protein [bacterium]
MIFKNKKNPEDEILHEAFEIGIALKGINGLFETILGIALFFISPSQIAELALYLTRSELLEDPHDFITNYILNSSQHFSSGFHLFLIIFLLSHGLIKLLLVVSLFKKQLWAYPLGIAIFTGFGAYQMYSYFYSHSILLLILTVLDIIVIFLTWHEYQHIKRRK